MDLCRGMWFMSMVSVREISLTETIHINHDSLHKYIIKFLDLSLYSSVYTFKDLITVRLVLSACIEYILEYLFLQGCAAAPRPFLLQPCCTQQFLCMPGAFIKAAGLKLSLSLHAWYVCATYRQQPWYTTFIFDIRH